VNMRTTGTLFRLTKAVAVANNGGIALSRTSNLTMRKPFFFGSSQFKLTPVQYKRPLFSRLFSTKKNETKVDFNPKRPFRGHRLSRLPDNFSYTNKEELMAFYKTMAYYRRFEVMADTLYKSRDIRGFCHLYDGQEAVVTGMEAAIKKTDSVITAYRDHCHQISRGDTGGHVMAELTGKITGCSRGKGGSMHLYYPKGKFYGGNGIVGAQVPLGTGLAFAHKYKKDGGVAIAMYGDGAANQGQIFEAANMAGVWKLPMIFVCENNNYGMGTSTKRATGAPDFYSRGDWIPGLWVDGMDVLASKKAFEFAAEHCRAGNGPIFLELNTYRYHGHSMSDPGVSYRSREEVNQIRAELDCIENVKNRLLKLNWANEEQLKAVEKEVKKMADDDVEFAKSSKVPPPEELTADVHHGAPPPFIRAVEYSKSIVNKQ